jgi:hypothetical protein
MTARTLARVQTHQTQSLRTVAEAQHCNESLKQLIEEYEEIEEGWEEIRQTRERVYRAMLFYSHSNNLKQRVEQLEKLIG